MKRIFTTIFRYFLQGLLVFSPMVITVYFIYWLIGWTDMLMSEWLPFPFPGLGLVLILGGITLVGFLSSLFFIRPLIYVVEQIALRTPLVKIVYTSLKDLFSAFVGDEKKFDKPALVRLGPNGPYRIGFLTDDDLTKFGLTDMVSLYIPHAYNLTGHLYIMPRDQVEPIVGVSATEVMKYAVSGGVTDLKKFKTT